MATELAINMTQIICPPLKRSLSAMRFLYSGCPLIARLVPSAGAERAELIVFHFAVQSDNVGQASRQASRLSAGARGVPRVAGSGMQDSQTVRCDRACG